MNVTVRVFAYYAELLGSDHMVVSVTEPATVASLRLALAAVAPALPPRPLIAVNEQYADDDLAIRPGDEVAVVSPVAGG
jgi:molybdopterin converting factor small subunit